MRLMPQLCVGRHIRKIMHIRVATTDVEIADCFPVMRELRPHIAENQFLSRIRSQMNSGYRLAFVQDTDGVVAVAGFRVGENLAWGRFLYVDDLVTLPAHRSKGYSGTQRKDAHRFYEREGMTMASFHFVENVAPNPALQRDAPQAARP